MGSTPSSMPWGPSNSGRRSRRKSAKNCSASPRKKSLLKKIAPNDARRDKANGAVPDQLFELLVERGFNVGLSSDGLFNDYSYVADYDQRTQNKLKVTNLKLQLESAVAQNMTILLESLETTYS